MFVQETSLYAAALAIKAAVINVFAELQWNENQLENLSLRKLALICKLHKNGKMEGAWYFIGIVSTLWNHHNSLKSVMFYVTNYMYWEKNISQPKSSDIFYAVDTFSKLFYKTIYKCATITDHFTDNINESIPLGLLLNFKSNWWLIMIVFQTCNGECLSLPQFSIKFMILKFLF